MELRRFTSLPLELVSRILSFLSARDVVQLRLVSRLFHEITRDPLIWKEIYTNARVPRPAGPFASQSTHFLAHTLTRSECLAEGWTTQPLRAISSTQIRLPGSIFGQPRIIGGRWLITFESYRQIVFHDIETHSRQVLWEDLGAITSWDACHVISARGLLVYVVFRKDTGSIKHATWKLLEFRVHDETGRISHSTSLDVPHGARYSGGSVSLISDKTPFLYITGQELILDTRTRIFYEFPEFSSELTTQASTTPHRLLLTNSHAIAIYYCHHGLLSPQTTATLARASTLIQAFTLPEDPHPAIDTTGVLSLSHEGILSEDLVHLFLIRNSILDSVTNFMKLRFLRLQLESNTLCFSCVDLALPRSLSDDVLPLSVAVYTIFTLDNGNYRSTMPPIGNYVIEASNDGYVRGFSRNRAMSDNQNSRWITKFTIDATGDKCVAQVGQAMPPRWLPNEEPPHFSMLSFDGTVGRCCYVQDGQNSRGHGTVAGFVDVAVVDVK